MMNTLAVNRGNCSALMVEYSGDRRHKKDGESGSSGDSSPQENTMRIPPREKAMVRPTLVMASPVTGMPPDGCLIVFADAGRPAIASEQRRRGQGQG